MKKSLVVLFLFLSACGPEWLPLYEGEPNNTHYTTQLDPEFHVVDVVELRERWEVAAILVLAPPEATAKARIMIMGGRTWRDSWGRNVAGLTSMSTIYVGSDLAALAHELAHWRDIQAGILEDGDVAHARWQHDGTQAALDAFDGMYNVTTFDLRDNP